MLLLQACSATEEEAAAALVQPPTADTEIDVELTGSVGDGPIVNASLRVVANDGTVISSTMSDQDAGYNIQFRTKGKFYPLTIDATGGTDLATNAAPGFTLASAATAPSKKSVANVNPFTTLALAVARQSGSGGLSTTSIATAVNAVTREFNSGLTSALSLDPMTVPIDDTNLAEIIKASEALAEVFRRTHAALARPGVTIDDVIDAIAADLVDGALDGVGAAATDRRISALAVVTASQVMLEAMTNELQVGGQDVTPVLDSLIQRLASGQSPALTASRPVTSQMIVQAKRGVAVAILLADSPALQSLSAALDTVTPGMNPAAVRQALPQSSSAALTTTVSTLSTGTATDLDTALTGQSVTPAPPPPPNNAPVISGTPATSVDQDTPYSFVPTASDADGDALVFVVTGLPAWATFNSGTGALTGTPLGTDVGSHGAITISVSDGMASASLASFSITVNSVTAPPQSRRHYDLGE